MKISIGIIGPAVFAAGLFLSCTSNEIGEVLEHSEMVDAPVRSTRDVVYTYTESGRVTNRLKAGQVDRFENPDSTYSVISDGFELSFYTKDEELDGRLTAKNGFISGDNSVMIARDSVVFVNRLDETLRTEELYWYQDSSKVYTDKFVTIEREDAVIYGKGLVSNQNFSDYIIREPTGVLYLDDNEK